MNFTIALIANGLIENAASLAPLVKKHSKIIAVDGGLVHCERMGIVPDLILGDLDSAEQKLIDRYPDVPSLRFSANKDETDTELAILEALTFHPEKIVLFGGLGKRIDHTLYNLNLLQRFAFNIEIESEEERIFPLKPKDVIETYPGQTVSLIPLTEPVSNVSSRGLKWELNQAAFNRNFMSISNISIGTSFTISYDQGCLICCLQK